MAAVVRKYWTCYSYFELEDNDGWFSGCKGEGVIQERPSIARHPPPAARAFAAFQSARAHPLLFRGDLAPDRCAALRSKKPPYNQDPKKKTRKELPVGPTQ